MYLYAHLLQVRSPVSDTTPQIKVRVTRDGQEWMALGVSMTPPPRVQLCSNWSGGNPAPFLPPASTIGLPTPGRSAPRLRLAHCPISQTQQDSGRWEGKALEVVEWEWD